ncbi:CLUMA_CG019385, isoform A [Clunio marinus]|uniref:CLUMA_CG019385, isoform A n=1 Tax=Clunio marinus TaxID=568069 RepID=A0A1J1J317_9DIPT|nr:CLUMA_CG019385, isoform A [Clunio marinus]
MIQMRRPEFTFPTDIGYERYLHVVTDNLVAYVLEKSFFNAVVEDIKSGRKSNKNDKMSFAFMLRVAH